MNNFRLILLSLTALWLFTFASCEEDPEPGPTQEPTPSGVELSARLVSGSAELELFTPIDDQFGRPLTVELVKFYLSDIRLVDSVGEEVLLSEIEIFDVLGDRTSYEYELPSGDYQGIRFDVGVPVTLNGTENPDFETFIYDPTHPLANNNGMYWAWQTGYRFFVFDGRVDTNTVAPLENSVPFSIHLGTDTAYLPLEFDLDFAVPTSGTIGLDVAIDISKCISGENDSLDMTDPFENSFHGGSNTEVALRFRSLLRDAITVAVR